MVPAFPRLATWVGLTLLVALGIGRAEALTGKGTRIGGDLTTNYYSDLQPRRPVASIWQNRFNLSVVHPLTSGIEAGGFAYGSTQKTTNLSGYNEELRTSVSPYVSLIQHGRFWRATGRASRNPSPGFSQSSPVSELLEFNLGVTPKRLPTLQMRINENRNFDSFELARLNQRSREIFSTMRYSWNILSLQYQHQRNTFTNFNDPDPERVNITEGLSLSTAREFRPTGYLGLSMSFNSQNSRSQVDNLTVARASNSSGSLGFRYTPHSRFVFTESISGRMSEDKLTRWTTEDLAFTSAASHQVLPGLNWNLQNSISTHNRRSPLSSINRRTDLSATAKPWTPVTLSVAAFQQDGSTGGSRGSDAEGYSSNIFARVYPELDVRLVLSRNLDRINKSNSSDGASLSMTSRHFRSTDLSAGIARSGGFNREPESVYTFSSSTQLRNRTFQISTSTEYRDVFPSKVNSQVQLSWSPRNLFITVGGNWEHQLGRDRFTLPTRASWRMRPTRFLLGTLEYSNSDLLTGTDGLRVELTSSGTTSSSMSMNYQATRPRTGDVTQNFNITYRKWF